MSAPPDSPAAAPALSPAQHKAQLWADARLSVYAVMMGTRIPDLPARLAKELDARQLDDFDCLRPGALPPAEQRNAPYVARLFRESAFTDWLLFEAAAGLGEWGVIVTTPAKLMPLRTHLRNLLVAQIPGGLSIPLDWMDATLLRALLPLFDPAGLTAFMGPLETLVIPGAELWSTARASLGRLALVNAPVAKAG